MHRRSFYNAQIHDTYASRFASELADVLYDLGITHKELARAMGVAHHTVDSWTRIADPKIPAEHNLQRLCIFLDTIKPGTGRRVAGVAGQSPPADWGEPPPPGKQIEKDLARAPTLIRANDKVLTNIPTNIPVALTQFVGRRSEAGELRQLLNGTRLLTLTGVAGVGKTRLAIEVARGLGDLSSFSNGIFLAELDVLRDPGLIPASITQALGLPQPQRAAPLDALIEQIGGKCVLLVLDNCEHLIEACASIAEKLLQGCPQLHIIATSREPLDCSGERVWLVSPLSVPPQTEDWLSSDDAEMLVAQSEAALLFTTRARERQPDFRLTPANASHVAQICRRLDGIPLALELAAARISGMAVEDLAERLDASLDLLVHGRRTGSPRQQALHASLDWSHDLLAPSERMLFRRLAVFVGGWTLDAVEAVCAGDGLSTYGLLSNLLQLVDKSLVVADKGEGGTRYRFLETVRQYALEHLAVSNEAEAVRQRHALFYTLLAVHINAHLFTSNREAWKAAAFAELGNFRAALGWSLAGKADDVPQVGQRNSDTSEANRAANERVEIGLRLAGHLSLFWFWALRGENGEALRWIERALAQSDPSQRTADRAQVLLAAAALTAQQGRLTGVKEWAEESEEICREIGDKLGLARALMILGETAFRSCNLEAGRSALRESRDLARAAGRSVTLILALFRRGDCELEFGDVEAARECLQEGLAVCKLSGEIALCSVFLVSLGRIAYLKGEYQQAQSMVEEALAIRIEEGEEWPEEWPLIGALNSLADILRCRGDYERAASLANRSLAILRKYGVVSSEPWVLYTMGCIARQRGDQEEAIRLWTESLAARREQGKSRDAVLCMAALAGAYYLAGQITRAARLFGAVDRLLETMDVRWPPFDRDLYSRDKSEARSALGEKQFNLEMERGRAMQEEEAIAFVLAGHE